MYGQGKDSSARDSVVLDLKSFALKGNIFQRFSSFV